MRIYSSDLEALCNRCGLLWPHVSPPYGWSWRVHTCPVCGQSGEATPMPGDAFAARLEEHPALIIYDCDGQVWELEDDESSMLVGPEETERALIYGRTYRRLG